MDVFEAMAERRSVREYTSQQVDRADLDRILEAGRMSASWVNTQCWEIILVRDPEMKEKLADTLSERNPARKAVVQAPLVIVACGKKGKSGCKKGEHMTVLGDWLMFDVALFLGNVTHAAHALGYGTVHVGLFDQDEVARLLRVPDDVQVVEIVPLGRPKGPIKSAPPRKDIREFCHEEKFQGTS
jgi:nitroreductase